ncbi:MAG: ATPase [Oscillospiraceae bacterium]|jgi:vacuolar-type H+-ATPase subunit H|nr:ATPase [Oscillospiraceae bacterium]
MRSIDKCKELLEELEELIANSAQLPLSGGKVLVNADQALEIVQELQNNLPQELAAARELLVEKDRILRDAENEKREVLRKAEAKARHIVDSDTLVVQARRKSDEILANANAKAREIFLSAKKYAEDIFAQTDDTLNAFISRVRTSRQNLKNISYSDFVKMPDVGKNN